MDKEDYQLELEFLNEYVKPNIEYIDPDNVGIFNLKTSKGIFHIGSTKSEWIFFNFFYLKEDGSENDKPSMFFKYKNNRFYNLNLGDTNDLDEMNKKWFSFLREKRLSKILNKYNGRRIL